MIGIVSDTHGNRENALAALDVLHERGIETVIHCGDVGNIDVVSAFAGLDAWFVLGNVDRDFQSLSRSVSEVVGPGRLAMTHTIERGGKTFGICHGHTNALDRFIEADEVNYVVCGHTHKRRDERIGSLRVINPGALGGLKRQSRSFAVLDEKSDRLEVIEV